MTKRVRFIFNDEVVTLSDALYRASEPGYPEITLASAFAIKAIRAGRAFTYRAFEALCDSYGVDITPHVKNEGRSFIDWQGLKTYFNQTGIKGLSYDNNRNVKSNLYNHHAYINIKPIDIKRELGDFVSFSEPDKNGFEMLIDPNTGLEYKGHGEVFRRNRLTLIEIVNMSSFIEGIKALGAKS